VGIGFGVVGLAGVVVGSAFLANGLGLSADADGKDRACRPNCNPLQQKQIHDIDVRAANAKNTALAAFVVGGAALIGGVTLIVLGKPAPKRARAFVAPWFSGNAGGIHGAF
jgi:hypothetical protein